MSFKKSIQRGWALEPWRRHILVLSQVELIWNRNSLVPFIIQEYQRRLINWAISAYKGQDSENMMNKYRLYDNPGLSVDPAWAIQLILWWWFLCWQVVYRFKDDYNVIWVLYCIILLFSPTSIGFVNALSFKFDLSIYSHIFLERPKFACC